MVTVVGEVEVFSFCIFLTSSSVLDVLLAILVDWVVSAILDLVVVGGTMVVVSSNVVKTAFVGPLSMFDGSKFLTVILSM